MNSHSVPCNTDTALTIPVDHNERQPENPCPIKSTKKARSIRDPDTVPDFSHCEFYSRVEGRTVRVYGEWMSQAGFINGMPVKIRVMKDCIVITPQNTRELWGCIEGMSVTYINHRKVKTWLKDFPGALNDTGDIPVIKRGR
ncbi:SymE family type I addiction module toxin [Salmonella enterica]|uniref:SymE family type I addiction module toxin n=1 Tax=Salmonella enterica subsp. enterica serovar Give var. 15 str. CFSAN004343 TaxID=1410932 RepID=A0AAU7EQA9_SALET|nr:SymE family type I addiction module toxin [Salmonella enterica]MCT7156304.1 type I toxin-antitoxin system SymE family toxin [Salmonella enterica subsp. enterica serovar Gaminara]MDJ4482550.1 type I toxin-antitoxin system SymE family toxin [Salmonella enterica]MDJ5101520.1 type I toxin-antitoxin system SymE family toxin [Salmonella enterica]MDJ5115249.1 type I toxin-antitoxin system SymE family toxin [Salmonella enterica]MDJ6522098.1 type I toxin-antitoxin system SymE family toxin [Salmonell